MRRRRSPGGLIFIEGGYLDRSAQGLKPKFVKIDPPAMLTLSINLSPWELLEKLAALVPPPRVHPVR